MRTVRWSIAVLALAAILQGAAAGSFDVTGRWESRYSFGGIEEIMIAEIEQIEESIIGSYAVEVAPSGEGYGGVIFGTIDGDKVKAFYLATRSSGGGDPLTTISFTDGRLVDEETIRGEFHYRDSDQTVLSGPYEAKRI
ncbi:MAG TPA: hypothetical protein PLN41_04195 [Methanothrix sp.]|nr:hypothetical protein [Methanothrix sp.]HPY72156.1 hypothetical protein [Methanothrix sp.]